MKAWRWQTSLLVGVFVLIGLFLLSGAAAFALPAHMKSHGGYQVGGGFAVAALAAWGFAAWVVVLARRASANLAAGAQETEAERPKLTTRQKIGFGATVTGAGGIGFTQSGLGGLLGGMVAGAAIAIVGMGIYWVRVRGMQEYRRLRDLARGGQRADG